MIKNLEYLISYSSFLKKFDKITEIKNKSKDIFVLIPIMIILAELIKMKKRETRQKYKDNLEEVIKMFVQKKES